MECDLQLQYNLEIEGVPKHLTMQPNPERYLYITFIATIVTEAEMLRKTILIQECKIKFS